jgi:heme/copper-type cytochrome/quinol oxidase subunit 2
VNGASCVVDNLNANYYHAQQRSCHENTFAVLALCSMSVFAADSEVMVVIRDHKFDPAEIRVPSGQKVKLIVHNQDATPEEFESHELNREKVIAPGTKVNIYIGPLKPGRYPFW